MKNDAKTTRSLYTVFKQLVQYIPAGIIPKLSKKYGIQTRKFSVLSQIVAILYGHIARAWSLNEICDAAALHSSQWSTFREATPPKRNTFSHANRTRDPDLAQELYWETLNYLQSLDSTFTQGRKHSGFLTRFKRDIYAIDSTVIPLALNCINWAKHRAEKAAAKTHLCLNIGSFLPCVVIAESAAHHDSTRSELLAAGLKKGDILLADKAYVEFGFLHNLNERGIFFVMRCKDNLCFNIIEEREITNPKILSDDIIELTGLNTLKKYPSLLRRITAYVEIDGKERQMTFITNNLEWSPWTVAELYKSRWLIELFFKELKQSLQLQDFIGYNENAVKWQIWIGLLAHLILRFLKHRTGWKHSFSRLVGLLHNGVWVKVDLLWMLMFYGTARSPNRPKVFAEQLYFQGFELYRNIPMG